MSGNFIDFALFLGVFITYIAIVAVAVIAITAPTRRKDEKNDIF